MTLYFAGKCEVIAAEFAVIFAMGRLKELRELTVLPSLRNKMAEETKTAIAVMKDCKACLRARITEFRVFGQYSGLM